MVLTLTDGCQVAQTVAGSLLHRVELGQYLLAKRCQLTGHPSSLQRLYGHSVVALFQQVAGTVTSIV